MCKSWGIDGNIDGYGGVEYTGQDSHCNLSGDIFGALVHPSSRVRPNILLNR